MHDRFWAGLRGVWHLTWQLLFTACRGVQPLQLVSFISGFHWRQNWGTFLSTLSEQAESYSWWCLDASAQESATLQDWYDHPQPNQPLQKSASPSTSSLTALIACENILREPQYIVSFCVHDPLQDLMHASTSVNAGSLSYDSGCLSRYRGLPWQALKQAGWGQTWGR